jgi:flagellar M-ring protein FliF
MSPLYTDLSESDAGNVVQSLESSGISYTLKDGGKTIYVPTDVVYQTRLAMSASGLPSSNDGYALLDKQGITTSEFKQRTAYQRAIEGELAHTIEALDSVDRAVVHIALPNSSAFVDDPGSPTASVVIRSTGRGLLNDDQIQSIAYLVSSSIRNMKPEDVAISDTQGNILRAPGAAGFSSGGSAQKQQSAFEQSLGTSLTQLLGRTTGLDKVSVTVSAVMNMDEKTQVSERYTKPVGTKAETDTGLINTQNPNSETYKGVTPNNNSVLGPDGAPVSTPSNNAQTDYTKSNGEVSYLYDKVVEEVKAAPGSIVKLSVAVVVDDKAVAAEKVADIEGLVRAAAGLDTARGDQVVVTRLPFVDQSTELAASDKAAKDAESSRQMMALIRSALIAIALIVGAFFAYRSVRKARTVVVESIDISGLSNRDNATSQTSTLITVREDDDEDFELERDETADKLSRLADTNPEAVAQVLRTWLSDPRG